MAAERSMRNIEIAINELRRVNSPVISQRIQSLTPENVYNHENAMFELLETIKTLFDATKVGEKKEAEAFPEVYSRHEDLDQRNIAKDSPSRSADILGYENESSKGLVESPSFVPAHSAPPLSNLASAKKPRNLASPPKVTEPGPSRNPHKPLKPQLSYHKSHANSQMDIQIALTQGVMIDQKLDYLTFPMSTGPLSSLSQNEIREDHSQSPEKPATSVASRNTVKIKHASKSETPHVISTARADKPVSNKGRGRENRVPSEMRASKSYYQRKDEGLSQLNVPKVDIRTKHKLLEWFQEIQLIKEGAVTIAEFPNYCRNGVLFADLISRLEGVRDLS